MTSAMVDVSGADPHKQNGALFECGALWRCQRDECREFETRLDSLPGLRLILMRCDGALVFVRCRTVVAAHSVISEQIR